MPTSESIFSLLSSMSQAAGQIRGVFDDQADAVFLKAKADIDKMLNEGKATMTKPDSSGMYINPDQWESNWTKGLGPEGKPLYAGGKDPATVIRGLAKGNPIAETRLKSYFDQKSEEVRSGFAASGAAYTRYNAIISVDDAISTTLARADLSREQKQTEIAPLFAKMRNLITDPADFQKWRDAKEAIVVDGFLSAPARSIVNKVTPENEVQATQELEAAMAGLKEVTVGDRKIPISQEVRDKYLQSAKSDISQRASQLWTQRERTDNAMLEKFKTEVMLGNFDNETALQSMLTGIIKKDPVFKAYLDSGSGVAIAGMLQGQIDWLRKSKAYWSASARDQALSDQKTAYYKNVYLPAAGEPGRLKSISTELQQGVSWAKDMDPTLRTTLRDDIEKEISSIDSNAYTKRTREEQIAVDDYYAQKVGPAFFKTNELEKLAAQLQSPNPQINPLARFGSSSIQILNFIDNRINQLKTPTAPGIDGAPDKLTTAEFWSVIMAKVQAGESEGAIERWAAPYSTDSKLSEEYAPAMAMAKKLIEKNYSQAQPFINAMSNIEKTFGKDQVKKDHATKTFMTRLANGVGGKALEGHQIEALADEIVRPIIANTVAEFVAFSTGTRGDVEGDNFYGQKFDLFGGFENQATYSEFQTGKKDIATRYGAFTERVKQEFEKFIIGSESTAPQDGEISMASTPEGISYIYKGKEYIPYSEGGKIGFALKIRPTGTPLAVDPGTQAVAQGVPTGRTLEENNYVIQDRAVGTVLSRFREDANWYLSNSTIAYAEIQKQIKLYEGKGDTAEVLAWVAKSSLNDGLKLVISVKAMMGANQPKKEIQDFIDKKVRGASGSGSGDLASSPAVDAAIGLLAKYQSATTPASPPPSGAGAGAGTGTGGDGKKVLPYKSPTTSPKPYEDWKQAAVGEAAEYGLTIKASDSGAETFDFMVKALNESGWADSTKISTLLAWKARLLQTKTKGGAPLFSAGNQIFKNIDTTIQAWSRSSSGTR